MPYSPLAPTPLGDIMAFAQEFAPEDVAAWARGVRRGLGVNVRDEPDHGADAEQDAGDGPDDPVNSWHG